MTTTNLPESSTIAPQPLQVALIGYGNAGRIFHAPLISAVSGFEFACICSSQPEAVLADWPHVRCVATPEAIFADPSIDLVVIASPNPSHYPLALAALHAGKHVVVDKPCSVTLAETEHLLSVAQELGRVLTVFQNRRFDSDFLALQQVLASTQLGHLVHVESHFDRYRPLVPMRWRDQNLPGSGLWVDLGSHLVDQALVLFGMPDAVLLELAVQRDNAQVNDWFHAVLRYDSLHAGLRVVLHASTLVPELGPRWAVHGTLGSFTKFGLDSQEDNLKAGQRPDEKDLNGWGIDPQPGQLLSFDTLPGVASPVAVRRQAPELKGNYLAFYTQLRDHLWDHIPQPPVTPEQVRAVMQLLTLAEQSAAEGRFISLDF